jgi:predicted ester cyclase
MSTIEENRERVRQLFTAGFGGAELDIGQYVADGYVDHSPIPAPAPGPDGFAQRMAMLRSAFVDEVRFGVFLAQDDLVAFTWEFSGVHRGHFAGVEATGKSVTMGGINVERMADGRVVEHWSQFDLAGLMRRLTAP